MSNVYSLMIQVRLVQNQEVILLAWTAWSI